MKLNFLIYLAISLVSIAAAEDPEPSPGSWGGGDIAYDGATTSETYFASGAGSFTLEGMQSGGEIIEISDDLRALARGLKYDPLEIYNYVRNEIESQLYFGAKKGPRMTYLEASGNDLDKALLMLALIQASKDAGEFTGTATIQTGMQTISFAQPDINPESDDPSTGIPDVCSLWRIHPDAMPESGAWYTANTPYLGPFQTASPIWSGFDPSNAGHRRIALAFYSALQAGYNNPARIEVPTSGSSITIRRFWVSVDGGEGANDLDPWFVRYQRTEEINLGNPAGGWLNAGDLVGGEVIENSNVWQGSSSSGWYDDLKATMAGRTAEILTTLRGPGVFGAASVNSLLGSFVPIKWSAPTIEAAATSLDGDGSGNELSTNLAWKIGLKLGDNQENKMLTPSLGGRRITLSFGYSYPFYIANLNIDASIDGGPHTQSSLQSSNLGGLETSKNLKTSLYLPGVAVAVHEATVAYSKQGGQEEHLKARHVVMYGFTPSGGLLRDRQLRLDRILQEAELQSPGSTTEGYIKWLPLTTEIKQQIVAETLYVQGLTWLWQTRMARRVIGDVFDCNIDKSFSMGRMSQVEGYFIDIYQQFATPVGRNGEYNEPGGAIAGSYVAMLIESSLEHSLIEQSSGRVKKNANGDLVWNPGASTVNVIVNNAITGYLPPPRFGVLTPENLADNSSTLHLNVYPGDQTATDTEAFFANLENDYYDVNQRPYAPPPIVLMPDYGRVGISGPWGETATFRGSASISPSLVRMAVGEANGGYSIGGSLDPVEVVTFNYSQSDYFERPVCGSRVGIAEPSYKIVDGYAADPVNMANGSFDHAETDLVLGDGDAPRGLTFERYYSSNRGHHDVTGLGFGWTHNWDIRMMRHSAGAAALGGTVPRQMAPFLAAVRELKAVLTPPRWADDGNGGVTYGGDLDPETIEPQTWLAVAAIAKWAGDQVTHCGVTAVMGREQETFVRMPDGAYEPGTNTTMTLTEVSGGEFELSQRHGATFKYFGLDDTILYQRGRAKEMVGPYGQTLQMTYSLNGVSAVSSAGGTNGYGLAFSYEASGSRHLSSVTERRGTSSGRSVAFSYANGLLVSATDPENLAPIQGELSGGATAYEYVAPPGWTKPSCLSKITDPLGRVMVQTEYDWQGRAIRQDSGNVEVAGGNLLAPWEFYYSGNCSREVDPLGGKKRFRYDERGRLVEEVDAEGHPRSIVYDEEDRVVEEVDAAGNRTTTVYDGNHIPIEVSEYPGGATVPFKQTIIVQLDGELRPLEIRDIEGRTTYYTYPVGTTATDPATITRNGETTAYTYEASGLAAGLVLSVEDRDGLVTGYQYDQWGNLQTETKPGGFTKQYSNFTLSGDPQTVVDENGFSETALYNNRRDEISRTKSDPAVPGYSSSVESLYDAAGKLSKQSVQTGRSGASAYETAYEYSSTGKPTSVHYGGLDGVLGTGDDQHEAMSYDARDWLESEQDVTGNVTSYSYLANGWLDTTTLAPDPGAGVRLQHVQSDVIGRPVTATDVLGFDTNTLHVDQPAAVTLPSGTQIEAIGNEVENPEGITIKRWMDHRGNLRMLSDGRGKNYEFGYDHWDRETVIRTPNEKVFSTTYTAEGRVQQVNAHGTVTTNGYNQGTGRLQTTTHPSPGGGVVNFSSYDNKGNLLSASENGKTISRTYDAFDRVRTYTNADGWTIGYEYHNDGQLKTLYYPGGTGDANPFDNPKHVDYDYYADGKLKTIQDWAGRVTTYHWRTDGRLAQIERPNNTTRILTYDTLARVEGITERSTQNGLLATYRLKYRKSDDLSGRFSHPNHSGNEPTIPINTAAHDDDNAIAGLNGAIFDYDDRGNLQSGILDSSGLVGDLSFDSRDRLTGTTSGGSNPESLVYTYDLEGSRTSMSRIPTGGSEETTHYVFDPHGGALVRLLVRTREDGSIVRYIYGMGLSYEIEEPEPGGTETARFYHFDNTGSTTLITDGSGAVVEEFGYTPYGQTAYHGGSATSDTPFRFAGFLAIMTDPNGLLNMRARFYSPALRRFISMDPARFEGGENWYAYAAGNPLGMADPTGFGPESVLNTIQTGLAILGMTPVVGFVFDLANAGISLYRGDYVGVTASLAAAIPAAGFAAGAALAYRQASIGSNLVRGASRISSEISGTRAVAAKGPVQAFEVGTADALKARSVVGDGLDIHHVAQAHPLEQIIPGYNRTTAPAITVPRAQHSNIPTVRGPYMGTARSQLSKDIWDLRNYTDAPNRSLQELINLNKQMYPGAYTK